jgi:hypothetical protein
VRCCGDGDVDGYSTCTGDTNDGDAGIHPGASELCDGKDNNSNGTLDEVCDGTCDIASQPDPEVEVTGGPSDAEGMSMVWTGEEFAVAWADDRDGNNEIYFARRDPDGLPVLSDARRTDDPGNSTNASLAWNGDGFGLMWRDNRSGNYDLYFARLDRYGTKIGEDIQVTDDPGGSLGGIPVWNGSGYGVVWPDDRDGNYEVYFTRLDPMGNKIGVDRRMTNLAAESWNLSIAWTGSEYGVTWRDHASGYWVIHFLRIDALGNPVGSPVPVTAATYNAYHPSITWNGSEYGIVWQDQRHGQNEIYFVRYDSGGALVPGSEVRVTNNTSSSAAPKVVWTGEEYGVAWYDNAPGNFEVYFTRLDTAGLPTGGEVRLSNATSLSEWPQIAWSGTRFGVIWRDKRSGDYDLYMTVVKCCGNDLDADTYNGCEDCNDLDADMFPANPEVCDYKDNDCDGIADNPWGDPTRVTGLAMTVDHQGMTWDPEPVGDRYDVVKGNVNALIWPASGFDASLLGCLENDDTDTQATDTANPTTPGTGFYYLVRSQNECRLGSYNNNGPYQIDDRDPGIEASPSRCP